MYMVHMELMRYPGVLPVDTAGQTGGTSAPVAVGTGPRQPEQPTVRTLTWRALGQTGRLHGLVRGAGSGAVPPYRELRLPLCWGPGHHCILCLQFLRH